MMTLPVLILYLAGFVFTYRRAYLILEKADPSGTDTGFRAANAAMAMIAAVVWPVVLVGYGIYRLLTPVTPAERRADLDARERKIEQMERDLGL